MKKIFISLLLTPSLAFANVGAAELGIVASLLSGNMALVVGLVAGAFGLYIWLIERRAWGLVMILLGVAVTAFPGIFQAMYNGINPFIQQVGGQRDTLEFAVGGG